MLEEITSFDKMKNKHKDETKGEKTTGEKTSSKANDGQGRQLWYSPEHNIS